MGDANLLIRKPIIALLALGMSYAPLLSIAAPAIPPIATKPHLEPKAVGADWQQILSLRSKPMREYLEQSSPLKSASGVATESRKTGSSRLDHAAVEKDMATYLVEAERLKLFPDVPGFREWWKKNGSGLMKSQVTSEMRDASLTEYTTVMYIGYAAQRSAEIDRQKTQKVAGTSKPNTTVENKSESQTSGESFLKDTMDLILDHPLATIATGSAVFVGNQLKHLLLLGPGVSLFNVGTEPWVGPVRKRLERIINEKLGVRSASWRNIVSGDASAARNAMKQANAGGELTGMSARYVHPAIGVKDFSELVTSFYNQMTKADLLWRAWMNADNRDARNTGFELLYNQYMHLSERLNTYRLAISASSNDLDRYTKELLSAGAKREEIDDFLKAVTDYQNTMVFDDPRHASIGPLRDRIQFIAKTWTDRKISEELINQAYGARIDNVIAKNRKAFALTAYLKAELFFQENNIAMKDLPEVQKWQEQAREASGLYRELDEDQDNITRLFKKMGIKYDVGARIAQRGYPLGGPQRPANVPAIVDPLKELFSADCSVGFSNLKP